jgi:hypothetical protein
MFFAAVVLVAGLSAPAAANGTVRGEHFTLSLQDLPDVCPVAATMYGRLSIYIVDDQDDRFVMRTVPYTVTVATPFGKSIVKTGSFRVPAGKTKSVRFGLPVDETAKPGVYTLTVSAMVDGETLSVDHVVEITAK